MDNELAVYAELDGEYVVVGRISSRAILDINNQNICFKYDSSYLLRENAHSISACLPLREEEFDPQTTQAFFEGLVPEGSMRRVLSNAFHVGSENYQQIISRLNNESCGALVFKADDEDPLAHREYEPIDFEQLAQLAKSPTAQALQFNTTSRLSLAGAQAKVGLYRAQPDSSTNLSSSCPSCFKSDDLTKGWFLPKGSAPSTHIVKAADGTFPHLTINEALCMLTAKHFGFEVAECELIRIEDEEPLLVIKRFDREAVFSSEFPKRLHQEDFCQASGLLPTWKYEPTDENYVGRCASVINAQSSNPFGDRAMFFSSILFDWACGNCDNHLKNHSLLWSADWASKQLSPLYDITCTTIYPGLDREMGVSLCASRRIDDVVLEDILAVAKRAGVPEKLAKSELEELGDSFIDAVRLAERDILEQGFDAVTDIAEHIVCDFERRCLRVIRGVL